MSFLHRSEHILDGLHRFSCTCQRSPSQGWVAIRVLLPLVSCQYRHSWILPIKYFYKVLPLEHNFGLVPKHFALFGRGPKDMHNACLFFTVRNISWMACIVYLALASAALLRVGWQFGSSYLLFPANTGTVGFFPLSILIRCSPFVDLLHNFHALEHVACIIVGPSFNIPSL